MLTSENLDPKQPGIYQISDGKGFFYIGSSLKPLRRWRQHAHELRRGTHHSPYLQNIARKHGVESLTFETLLNAPPGMLQGLEQALITSWKPELNGIAVVGPRLMHTDPVYRERLKASLAKANARPEYRANRVSANPQKKAIRCLNDGLEFVSGGEAAKHYGVTSGSVSACTTGTIHQTIGGLRFEFCDGTTPPHGPGRKVCPVVCIETGEIYPSILGAAKAMKVTAAALRFAIAKGTRSAGMRWALVPPSASGPQS